ncbi:MAG TPA: cytochrome c peroxidase, partial [Candidatus Angelobacter sp.]|nr:cytochrome c peroxidase [Candidatus Angelobacter sp.]
SNNNSNNAQPTNSNSNGGGKPTPTPTPSASPTPSPSPSPTPFVGNGGGGGDDGGGGHGGRGGKGGGGNGDGGERKNGSLKSVSIPGPTATELSNVVLDRSAAIALGKAFFWDMQFGSDGKVACATCHSDAGADNRFGNQINPGQHRVDGNGAPAVDANTFYAPFGPNHMLTASDFPLHKIGGSDNSNVVGSQGMYRNNFNDVIMSQAAEDETPVPDEVFHILAASNSINTRRVTPRNAPSVVNAVFNYRNFWDGRAQPGFNGVNPFGAGDPNAFLLQADGSAPNGFSQTKLLLSNSSLASQAVGPPGSDTEMSATGRTFVKMGKKMLSLSPLAKQLVAPDDSVLGSLSKSPANGLNTTYVAMVQAAFQPKWWNSNAVVDANGNFLHTGTPQNTNEYSLMEFNFSMFWGVAIQMYESTLVSDDSRFDQYMDGNRNALTALEQRGFDRFTGKGGCSKCHSGAEFTDAAVSNVLSRGVVEQLENGAWHDVGFHNIGVRPSTDDQGIAAGDPSGLASLSVAAMASQGLVSGTAVPAGAAVSVNGAVKTPGLRNIEITGPYFLNGGQATLAQVVDFYSRGGDFPSADVDPRLERVSFSADDKAAVVAFLKSLTDERVRNQSAPFDHPSLVVPNGMAPDGNGSWVEQTITLSATGAGGGAPLPKFCQNIGAACD